MVVHDFIYPTFQNPPSSLVFHDQFSFRPTGSTTAAIITLLHKVTHLLLTNPYVIVIALDFSKAFGTVRHHTLLDKIAQLDLPDHIHNWLVNFFNGHSHQTKFGNVMSALKSISASIIQGSAIGPASYVVNGSDLQAVSDGNDLSKYADDTYLIIPAVNVDTRSTEISHITEWAKCNNLQLNLVKSQEIIFVDRKRKQKVSEPVEISGLQRVKQIKILGVIITNGLSVSPHVQSVIASCAQVLYALRILRAHGLCDSALQTIYRSVVISKVLYASSAWEGFANATDRNKIQSFISRSKRAGFCSPDLPDFDYLCTSMNNDLFNKVLKIPIHVLHPLLPPPISPTQRYGLRPRVHNRTLPERTSHLVDCNFIIRMLYQGVY